MDESIEHFVNATGADRQEARHLVDAAGGDLHLALDLYFQAQGASSATTTNNGNAISSAMDETSNASSSSVPPDAGEEDEVRAPIAPRRGVIVEASLDEMYAPRQRRVHTGSIFDNSRDLKQQQYERALASMNNGAGPSSASDADAFAIKRKTLADMFRPPVDLMHEGNLEQAREVASTRGQWLLVNVQDVQEFACQCLNRDIWSHSMVKEVVRNNFVFWQIQNDSAEGLRFQTYYRVMQFPFIAVIDPRTGELLREFRTQQGHDACSFCDQLTTFLEQNATPATAAQDHSSVTANTSVAHAPTATETNGGSLSHLKRKKPEEDMNDAKRRKSATESDHSDGSDSMPDLQKLMKKNLLLKSFHDHLETNGADLSVALRLPGGEREVLSIKDATKLHAVFLFINAMGYDSEEHQLVVNFPKRQLRFGSDAEKTLKEVGFSTKELVHVERI